MSFRKMGFFPSTAGLPVIIIWQRARVMATLSLRSMVRPSSSKQLAVRKLICHWLCTVNE